MGAVESEEAAARPARARRYDPERRLRIARAAMRVVGRGGVAGLSFRAVAVEADVPLGSLTYHFADKDELLQTAMTLAREQSGEMLAALLAGFAPERDLAAAMARLVEELSVHRRGQLVLDYEWIFATSGRPELAEANARWNEEGLALFERYAGPAQAQAASVVLHGLLFEAVALGRRIAAAEAEPLFRAVLAAS